MSKISELSDGGVIQGGDTLIAVRSGGNVKVTYGGSTTANIDGGTIDGTVIGGSTAAAGTFTTGQFNTSLNVDGTVTADGLTVDGSANVKSSGGKSTISIGDTAASTYAQLLLYGGATKYNWMAAAQYNANDAFEITPSTAAEGVIFSNPALKIDSNRDISFYEDTGTTAKFFWDASAESLVLGNGGSEGTLNVGGSASSIVARFTDATTSSVVIRPESGGAIIGTDGGGTLHLAANGSTLSDRKMTITPTGNVGIGTSSPFFTTAGRSSLSVNGTSSSILAFGKGGSSENYILADAGGFTIANTSATLPTTFYTNASERMRIDNGNLLVGTTSAVTGSVAGGFQVQNNSGTGTTINIGHPSGATSGFSYVLFSYNNSIIGSIGQSGTTAVLYNTSSDQRLKDNIVDAPSSSDDIDAIQVRSFDWKADGSHQKYGMVAQELMTVAPEAVSVPEDPEQMMGVDYSKLVPMLVKEIQSLRARVAQLETN